MDRNFSRSLSAVLEYEGGYSNNPRDPGHETNLGITLANFRAYVKPGGSVDDLKKLTRDQAAIVYRRQYWDAVMGSHLPDGVDHAAFDFAVNSGVSRAVKKLQAVVGVTPDGTIGPATLAAVGSVSPALIINGLCDARLKFLKSLSTFSTFGKGWTARVDKVRALAMSMAQQSPQAVRVEVKEVEVPSDKAKVIETSVAVVPKGADKRAWLWWPAGGLGGLGIFQSFADLPPLYKIGVGIGIIALLVILLFLGDRIIRRVKALRNEINAG